jgi:hypothetical protein
VRITGSVDAGELVRIGCERLDARDNRVTVQADRARGYAIELSSQLGIGSDFVRVRLEGARSDSARPLELNVQPGLTALDVFNAGGPTEVGIRVDGSIGGRQIGSSFAARLEGGNRIAIPDRADPSLIKVGKISTFHGAARSVVTTRRF